GKVPRLALREGGGGGGSPGRRRSGPARSRQAAPRRPCSSTRSTSRWSPPDGRRRGGRHRRGKSAAPELLAPAAGLPRDTATLTPRRVALAPGGAVHAVGRARARVACQVRGPRHPEVTGRWPAGFPPGARRPPSGSPEGTKKPRRPKPTGRALRVLD